MMSSDGEQQSVATCIQRGAKDYFVKPIRIGVIQYLHKESKCVNTIIPQKVKTLSKYVNTANRKDDKGGDQFERIKLVINFFFNAWSDYLVAYDIAW